MVTGTRSVKTGTLSLSIMLIAEALSAVLVAAPTLTPTIAYGIECLPPSCLLNRARHTGTAPTLLYRVDTRPPEEIFPTGFVSRGAALNLVKHVLGSARSGFIATTESPEAASRIASELVRKDHTKPVWIYTIRADHNFYSVPQSLDWIAAHDRSRRTAVGIMLAFYEYQQEWVAVGRVPPTQIQQAVRASPSIKPGKDFRSQVASHDPTNPSVVVNTSRYSHEETRGSKRLFTEGLAKKLTARAHSARGNIPNLRDNNLPTKKAAPATAPRPVSNIRLKGGGHTPPDNSFEGHVRVSLQYPWLAISIKELPAEEIDRYITSVHESLDIIGESREGDRLLQALKDIQPLPYRGSEHEGSLTSSRFVDVSNPDRALPVKVVVMPATQGEALTSNLNSSAAMDGQGTASIIRFDTDSYVPFRDTEGKLFLSRPAEILSHELVHAIHGLMGTTAHPNNSVKYTAVMPNVDDPTGDGSLVEDQDIPVDEAITHGREEVLKEVNKKYPAPAGFSVPAGFDSSGRKATKFEADADTVASSPAYTGSTSSEPEREHAAQIRRARINAWGLSETSIVSGMKVHGRSTPVRGFYASFEKDVGNPKMFTENGNRHVIYRIPGSQRDVKRTYRTTVNNWGKPFPGSTNQPVKTLTNVCGIVAHLLACEPAITRTKTTDQKRAVVVEEYYRAHPFARPAPAKSSAQPAESASPTNKTPTQPVREPDVKKRKPHELDVVGVREKAHQLQERILADKEFLKTLPQRTGQPMSAADIETSHTLLKAKIATLRGGTGTVTTGVGVGMILYGAITTVMNNGATTMDKIEATASLVPVVGQVLGLEEGIEHGDAETIAVNTIALASLVIAIDVGLFAYITVKAVTVWWQSLDPEEKHVVRDCAIQTVEDTLTLTSVLSTAWKLLNDSINGKPPPLPCLPPDFMAHERYKAWLRTEYAARHPRLPDPQTHIDSGSSWSSWFATAATHLDGLGHY